MRQYEARAASLGSASSDASARSRQHKAQLEELQSSAEVQQRCTDALKDVWGGCVQELEEELEQARRQRAAVETDRLRMLELHRKRVSQVQREGETRQARLTPWQKSPLRWPSNSL